MIAGRLYRGRAADDAAGGAVDVVVAGFDQRQVFEAVPHTPSPTPPAEGDAVLVAVDDEGEAWVVAWSS